VAAVPRACSVLEDTLGADVIYLNQSRRLQWGGRVSRIPYLASATFVSRRPVEVDGTVVPADVIERFYDVQRVSTAGMFAQYPLSLNNRVEVSAGIAGIGFKREVERFVYPSGFPAYYESQRLPSPAGVDLQQAAIAFVRDTSQFGIASPIRGTRFRAETEWTSGDLSFETALLDYRRYFFVRPVTFAMRALHVGRRGRGSEDFRVPILDIGDQNLVRGYELGSIGVQECTLSADATRCPEFERLIGSRIAVMNFEVRAQILGTPDFGLLSLPAAPTEAVFFVDVGAAWNAGDSVDWRFDRNTPDRVPVVSAGLAARTVLFGMLPLEFYYAYPFQRPQKDWVSGFPYRYRLVAGRAAGGVSGTRQNAGGVWICAGFDGGYLLRQCRADADQPGVADRAGYCDARSHPVVCNSARSGFLCAHVCTAGGSDTCGRVRARASARPVPARVPERHSDRNAGDADVCVACGHPCRAGSAGCDFRRAGHCGHAADLADDGGRGRGHGCGDRQREEVLKWLSGLRAAATATAVLVAVVVLPVAGQAEIVVEEVAVGLEHPVVNRVS
jgi:hypothetical protein